MSPELVIVLTAVLVAVPCALVGSFLVLRRMSMLGDAISHAVLPGIAIGFFLAGGPAVLPVLVGASLAGLLTVTLVELLYTSRLIKEDAAIGVVFPALFAFGVYLVSRYGTQVHLDTRHVLYGEIAYVPWDLLTVGGVTLGPRSLWVLGTVTLLDLGFVLLCYKELKLATFDPDLAGVLGFSPRVVHYALMAAVSVTTVAAFDAVGAILVVAMLIVPAATAYLLADRLPLMLGLAVGCGVVSAVLGYGLARAIDASIAGAMATVAGLLFGLAVLGAPRYGVLASTARRARQRRRFAGDLLVVHLARHGAAPASLDALGASYRWTPRFTRAVVRQVVAAGLARPAGDGDAGGAALVVTERGLTRASELASLAREATRLQADGELDRMPVCWRLPAGDRSDRTRPEACSAVMRRLSLSLDRSLLDHVVARLREGLAQALPLKPKPTRTKVRPCPHCQAEVDASLSKCPHCRRLFRI